LGIGQTLLEEGYEAYNAPFPFLKEYIKLAQEFSQHCGPFINERSPKSIRNLQLWEKFKILEQTTS